MKRGEIRWYKFHPPDKNRPVLIVSRDSVINYLNDITVVPITSTIRDIPSEVHLSREDGMPKECAINCDHIQTVPKNKIGNLITSLPLPKMEEVNVSICFALEID
ncbi:MAG TPA: PemK family transcriptional regulator [Lentisphaeria bacterium]|nr:MAG: PemK family transcriptional regulator [Lentisphaerae bacterium GWF2_49_21]HBC85897.1 PemK family transcriptional regulator [Lentisphaeria bacterium]